MNELDSQFENLKLASAASTKTNKNMSKEKNGCVYISRTFLEDRRRSYHLVPGCYGATISIHRNDP